MVKPEGFLLFYKIHNITSPHVIALHHPVSEIAYVLCEVNVRLFIVYIVQYNVYGDYNFVLSEKYIYLVLS